MNNFPQRPRMPYQLLDMSPDDYGDYLRANGYSERFVEKELEKHARLMKIYLPPRKQIADQPIRDTNDASYKALERIIKKKQDEIDEPKKKPNSRERST